MITGSPIRSPSGHNHNIMLQNAEAWPGWSAIDQDTLWVQYSDSDGLSLTKFLNIGPKQCKVGVAKILKC